MSKYSVTDLQAPLHSPAPVYLENPADEIDLIELFQSLWRKKVLIAGVTALCTCLGTMFAFWVPPVYEAKGYLRPAQDAQFSGINETGILQVLPEAQFVESGLLLQSQGLRWQLFNTDTVQNSFSDEDLLTAQETRFEQFNKQIAIKLPDPKKPDASDSIAVSFQNTDPDFAANVVNSMINLAQSALLNNLKADFESKVMQRQNALQASIQEKEQLATEKRQAQITRLEEANSLAVQKTTDQLDQARLSASQRRLDRIEELQEALKVAQSLNIIKPSTLSQLAESAQPSGGTAVRTEITNQREPLYMRGQELLVAELNVLKERENDDFTSSNIRRLESELELLLKARDIESLKLRENDRAFVVEQTAPLREELLKLKEQNVDFSTLEPARIDRMAAEPDSPVKPKKTLIMALSLVAGLMLGVFMALIAVAVGRSRQEKDLELV